MRLMPLAAIGLVLLGAAGVAAAGRPEPLTHGWSTVVSIDGTYVDNLFEEGSLKRSQSDVFTTIRADVRREVRAGGWLPSLVVLTLGGQLYDRTTQADNVFYEAEAGYRFHHVKLGAFYRGTPKRLLFIAEEPGVGRTTLLRDVLYRQSVVGAKLKRTFLRSRRLRLGLRYQSEMREFQSHFRDRDFVSYYPRFEARYRIASWLSPHLRCGYEIQDARAANRSREGIRIAAGFESTWRRLGWGARWDLTWWDFADAPRGESNFDRQDDRNSVLAHVSIRMVRGLTADLHYRWLDGASTRADRNFTKNEVGGGIAYRF